VEKLFVPIRSTKKSDFPRMNFKGGATSLTMLSSHHWPGMMLAFFMMLLTPEGWEVCKDCFQKEDMEIPDVNWKDAPKFDMNQLHVPEILQGDGQGQKALADIESHSDDEVDDVDEDIDEDYKDVDDGYVDNDTAKKNKKRTKRLSHCLAATHNLLVSYRTYLCFMLGTSVGPHQKRMIFRRFSYVFES
jgi:hypothetical protein